MTSPSPFPPPAFANPDHPTEREVAAEAIRIQTSFAYFAYNYCYIQDKESQKWIKFDLWDAQLEAADILQNSNRSVFLKARQMGLSWLGLCYILWIMLTNREQTALLISVGLREAKDLLERLKGIRKKLPPWMRTGLRIEKNNAQEITFANGMRCLSIASSSGDSYSCAVVMIDECDLIDDQEATFRAVQPTIEDGQSQLILISRVDKSKPNSLFKKIYRAARESLNSYTPYFIPWNARPSRDQEWYDEKKRDELANKGHLDTLFEQYPSNEEEALAPNSQDKRIPTQWLLNCVDRSTPAIDFIHSETPGVVKTDRYPNGIEIPIIPGLTIYELPIRKSDRIVEEKYTIGGDPAEGNPNSDDSAASVMNSNGKQVAVIVGKVEPGTFAEYLCEISEFYGKARMLIERNNHGHAVIMRIRELGFSAQLISGRDGKMGWLTNAIGKHSMYDNLASLVRDGEVAIRDHETFQQLASLTSTDLSAPDGDYDDRAVAFALNAMAFAICGVFVGSKIEAIRAENSPENRARENVFGNEIADSIWTNRSTAGRHFVGGGDGGNGGDGGRKSRDDESEFQINPVKRTGIFG